MITIGFDFDCVIADFVPAFIEAAAQNGFKLQAADITNYNLAECLGISAYQVQQLIDSIINPERSLMSWTGTLQPIEESVEYLHAYSQHTCVYIITARENCQIVKTWLLQQKITNCSVFCTNYASKLQVALDLQLDMFVDDNLDTCHEMQQAGITPIVLEQPWNTQDVLHNRVRNLLQLPEILKDLKL